MGCLLGKRRTAPDPENENRRSCYKKASETLIDVKDFKFIEFDSRLPLTKRQIFSLLQSWRGIQREMASVGTEMIVELLDSDPAVHKLFANFQDLSGKDELRASERVENLGYKVMDVLDDVVIHLDEYERVMATLRQVAVTHSQWLGKQPEAFMMIKQPFLTSVQQSLGDRFTENIHTIYKIFIDFIVVELIKHTCTNV